MEILNKEAHSETPSPICYNVYWIVELERQERYS